MPKLDKQTVILIVVVVLVTIKFRSQIAGLVAKIPVVGPIIAA